MIEAVPGLDRFDCCGGVYPHRRVRELSATPGVFDRRGAPDQPPRLEAASNDGMHGSAASDVTPVFFEGCPSWRMADEELREALSWPIRRTDASSTAWCRPRSRGGVHQGGVRPVR